jgi:hypothetical protein
VGKLTQDTIRRGYEALQLIDTCLKNKGSYEELQSFSSQFYTNIPHVFGMARPPVINNQQMLAQKIAMVDALSSVEIATKLMNKSEEEHKKNPIDAHYENLRCDMEPVDLGGKEAALVRQYMERTHGKTHSYVYVWVCIRGHRSVCAATAVMN